MGSADAAIFFHEQKLFSKERFEEDKVDLEWQDLSFSHGHKLVRARIRPQRVQVEHGGEPKWVEVSQTCRTLFLYNPETDDLRKKVIPHSTSSFSVYLANKLLGLELHSASVVDYVQYFGLVVEGEGQPFYFLAHENEIPWADGVVESERLVMMGRFDTIAPRNEDGSFQIDVEQKTFLGTSSFLLTLPCIYAGHAFESRMHVASTGFIRMEQDRGVAKAAFPAQASDLPFYQVEPTGELRRWIRRQQIKAAFVNGLIAIPLMSLYVAGICGSIAVVGDVVVGSISPAFSAWLNGLIARDWLLWLLLVGAATSLLYSLFSLLFLRIAEFVSARRPVMMLDAVVAALGENIKRKYRKVPFLVVGIARLSVTTLTLAFVSWVVIFASYHRLYGGLFDGDAIGGAMPLRTAFGATLIEMVDWFMRGEAPQEVEIPLRRSFDYTGSLTEVGRWLRLLAGVTIPFVVGEQIRRLLRYHTKES